MFWNLLDFPKIEKKQISDVGSNLSLWIFLKHNATLQLVNIDYYGGFTEFFDCILISTYMRLAVLKFPSPNLSSRPRLEYQIYT